MRGGRRAAVVALILAGAAGAILLVNGLGDGNGSGRVERPNLVVVMTDDQDLASLSVMREVRRRLASEGVSFTNALVSEPLCCPSRATFLTGRYAHNHGVRLAELVPPHRDYRGMRRALSAGTLPIRLREAGYVTGLVGKYLNGYGEYDRREVPPGWSEWHAPVGNDSLYGFGEFTLNENGRLRAYRGKGVYQTDLLTDKAVRFIERHAPGPRPFFLYLAYVAPHIGHGGPPRCLRSAQPSPRHVGELAGEPLPRPPSFDEADVADKPGFVRREPRLDAATRAQLRGAHRCRLESLLSVDEGVAAIDDALARTGAREDTVVVFTSDNGFLEGQHRLVASKFFPYEESVRVPLVVRGPGAERGSTVTDPVLNVDLAPTILDLATGSGDFADGMDGRSLVPHLEGGTAPARDLLLEGYYRNRHTGGRVRRHYAAIRSGSLIYVEYRSGERELYDLEADPHQLDNLADDPDYAAPQAALARRLEGLERCAGSGEDPVGDRPPCE